MSAPSEQGPQMVESKSTLTRFKTLATKVFSSITVEPLMLLDGLAFSNMHVYIENLQMDRICRMNAGHSEEVCHNLKADPDASVEVQQKFSVFSFYNGIIAAVLPLFFILFMGAWSDKYGRKVPLVAVQIGHLLHAAGYLLASSVPSWPVEFLLLVTFLDTLGGGTVSFLTAANSYVGDVTSEESRTSRVGLANSIWFLGGPAGTLLGTYIYSQGGYLPLFATSLVFSLIAVIYIMVFLPESHGPFAKKTGTESSQKTILNMRDSVAVVYGLESNASKAANQSQQEITIGTMIKDFFNPRRILDSFKSTLRKREGNTRALILLLIFTSLLRRLTRSPYVFAFTRHVLGWEATEYSLWVTYKNIVATTGTLVAVPLLSGYFGVSDNILAIVGALSGVLEYSVYGCISETQRFLIWLAPVAALLLNSCTIAQRAMLTKFVTKDEIGKVSAVLGALDGMMPMMQSGVYSAVYHATVGAFPAAHFLLGAAFSVFMIALFSIIIAVNKTREYDIEGAKPKEVTKPVKDKTLVFRTDSRWLTSESLALEIMPYQGMTSYQPNFAVQYQGQGQGHTLATAQTSFTASLKAKFIQGLKHSLKKAFGRKTLSNVSNTNVADPLPSISKLFIGINELSKGTLIPDLSQGTDKLDSTTSAGNYCGKGQGNI
ncbi:lysosomal proton-coupled steroid conjugate and bile acid symporter SLC46A3-like [Macrobrachium rosenbergii]|uniref:lysosomal proton-coupled steroid conjugate and bile acid symporter SLC46A3-like n=1 Tax=Macrobrachium rosenbergii TaxID=79674 RepID=UPI0034D5C889